MSCDVVGKLTWLVIAHVYSVVLCKPDILIFLCTDCSRERKRHTALGSPNLTRSAGTFPFPTGQCGPLLVYNPSSRTHDKTSCFASAFVTLWVRWSANRFQAVQISTQRDFSSSHVKVRFKTTAAHGKCTRITQPTAQTQLKDTADCADAAHWECPTVAQQYRGIFCGVMI